MKKLLIGIILLFCALPVLPEASSLLEITNVSTNKATLGQFDKFELSFLLSQNFTNPYDSDQVSVEATFTSPSGNQIRVYGFYYEPYNMYFTSSTYLFFNKSGSGLWKVRFTPQEVGQYTGTLRVITPNYGEATTAIPAFQAVASANPGFIRVSSSGKYLAFQNGSFFYPVGQNIYSSWYQKSSYKGQTVTEQEMTLRSISDAGGNSARLIIASAPNANLRWLNKDNYNFDIWPGYAGLNNINQMSTAKIDQMFELCSNLSIYCNAMILLATTIDQTSTGDGGWAKNPYNSANGGPASSTLDFLTNPEAKRLYKQELRYFISRWGYSPNLMSIELLQELDWTLYAIRKNYGNTVSDQVISATKTWSAEMTAYIRSMDPYQHLVSTSGGQSEGYITGEDKTNLIVNNMYVAGNYDLAQQHIYIDANTANRTNRNVLGTVSLAEAITSRLAKPWIFGEWGLDLSGANDAADTQGIGYHNAQWALMMRGTTPWPWYALPRTPGNNLPSIKAVRNFMSAENFEADFGQLTAAQIKANVSTNNANAYAIGIAKSNKALVWIQNTQSIESSAEPQQLTGVTLTVNKLSIGSYDVEYWNTRTGTIMNQAQLNNNGSLSVPIPSFTRDLAVKIKYHSSTPSCAAADINCDTKIDVSDLNLVASDFGKSSGFNNAKSDTNNDGIVDIYDVVYVASRFT